MTAGEANALVVLISLNGGNEKRMKRAEDLRRTLGGQNVVDRQTRRSHRLVVNCYTDGVLGGINNGVDRTIPGTSREAAAISNVIVVWGDVGYIDSDNCRTEFTTGMQNGAKFIFLADSDPKSLKRRLITKSNQRADDGTMTEEAILASSLLFDEFGNERFFIAKALFLDQRKLFDRLLDSIEKSITSMPGHAPASEGRGAQGWAEEAPAPARDCLQQVLEARSASLRGVEHDGSGWINSPARQLFLDWILAELDGNPHPPKEPRWYTGIVEELGLADPTPPAQSGESIR